MQVYTQLSIFLENEPGVLAKVCKALAKEKINILAHSVTDSVDYAVFRCVVSDAVRAVHLLESAGTFVLETEVLGIPIDDSPGSLGVVAAKLAAAQVNIDYAYGSSSPDEEGRALLILKTDDMRAASRVLKNK